MAGYDALIKDVRSSVAECPKAEIELYTKRAVIEFMRRSRCWREKVTINLTSGTSAYGIRVRPEGRADQVLAAYYVTDTTRRELRPSSPGGVLVPHRTRSTPGTPTHYSLSESGDLTLFPDFGGVNVDPAKNPRLELWVVAVPFRTSTQFPDFLLEERYEGLVAGVLHKLLILPNKPWTDPDRARMHYRDFHQSITEARQAAESGQWADTKQPRFRRW